jgi:[ribosomal protein S5]-alanine N-acetyltransferase
VTASLGLPLVTERLLLRPLRDDDVDAMHAVYGDPEVMRWVGTGAVRDRGGTRAIVRAYMDHQRRHGFAFWAVEDRATGVVVGDAGLALSAGVGPDVELGYTLARGWWGRGLATEAAAACVAAAFDGLGLRALTAIVEPGNAPSRHVLEKLGFRPAGRRTAFGREHVLMRLENVSSSE